MLNRSTEYSRESLRFVPTIHDLQKKGKAQEAFHASAGETARLEFGRRVFVRGVVEVSNYCRQNCSYCGMRRDNRGLARYRAKAEQIAELLIHHRPSSVTDINVQAGEDPVAVREVVLPLMRILKRETALGISVCLGSLSNGIYKELQDSGASIYIMKFETGDADLYTKLQSPGSFPARIENIRYLASQGWFVSSGFISGLPGQNEESVLKNFRLAHDLPLAGCSISPFIPGEETPLAAENGADIETTLNGMAALRMMRPDWVIPAVSALNLAQPGSGYQRGLRAGANLVTINLTPPEMRDEYLLYKRDRFIMTEERILQAIQKEGLVPSETSLAAFLQNKRSLRAQSPPTAALA